MQMEWIKSDAAKIIGACLGAVAAALLGFYPPPHVVGSICTVVVGLLAALGLVSGGTSGLRSNASNEQAAALQSKGVLPPG